MTHGLIVSELRIFLKKGLCRLCKNSSIDFHPDSMRFQGDGGRMQRFVESFSAGGAKCLRV